MGKNHKARGLLIALSPEEAMSSSNATIENHWVFSPPKANSKY